MLSYQKIRESWEKIKSREQLNTSLSNFRILFAYHSGKIENPEISYHNTREIFENGKVINFTGDLRTIFEIQNQKKCYEFLQDAIIEKRPLSLDLIKAVHQKLMDGCYDERRYRQGERPGEFKKHDYIIGDNVGLPPEEIEEELQFICDEVNGSKSKDPLITAAYFHLNFENIHPFADGNGRVGRTLLNYILMVNDHPPTIIYEEDKESYYMSLSLFDINEEIRPFVEFLKEETVKTWTKREHKKIKIDEMELEEESEL